jgi:hypothetical protein
MHTLRMVVGGLVLLGLFLGAAKVFGSPSWSIQRAAQMFIPVWFAVALGNMLIGMFSAGIPFLTELLVLVVVFGVPAGVAWYVGKST